MSATAAISPPPLLSRSAVVPSEPGGSRVATLAFHAAPMLAAACCFAFGVFASKYFYEPPALALLISLSLALVSYAASHRAQRLAVPPLCLAWMAAGTFCAGIHSWPDQQSALLRYAAKSAAVVEGTVVRAGPLRSVESTAPFAQHSVVERSQVIDLQITTIGEAMPPQSVSGGLRLTLYAPAEGGVPSYNCGDRLKVIAPIHGPERYNDPGVWDSTAYLLGQGIGALASAKIEAVAKIRSPGKGTFSCGLKALQQAAGERIMQFAELSSNRQRRLLVPAFFRLTEEDASMLAAMITGDRAWLQRRTRIGFERTGSFHLLVVSGLHLAIFAGIIFWMAQRVRAPRVAVSLITILASLAYAIITGFGQPVQRSFWMVTLYLLARLFWREKNALNAIGFAALSLLAANPPSIFDAGFQMTLLSVIAIAGIGAPIAEGTFAPYLRATRNLSLIAIDPALPPKIAQFRVSLRLLGIHLKPVLGGRLASRAPAVTVALGLRLVELLLISLVVEIVMSLPMAIYFHRVTALALPVNFLILPFLGLLLPSALLNFAVLMISPTVAFFPSAITAGLLHSVTWLIHGVGGMRSADLRIPGPSGMVIAAFIAVLGVAVYAARLPRFAVPASAAALGLMVAAVLAPRTIQHRPGALEITAIDVGQGDSLLVVTPEGKTLLIDAGGTPFGPPPGLANFDIGEDVISAYLWTRGIRRLDAVALTHAHADHIGGMPAVLANFHPREIWIGKNPHSDAYDAFLAEGELLGARMERRVAGDRFRFGAATVEVLAPDADYRPGSAPTNDDSLVLRIQFGQTSALLEGDAEAPSEKRMVGESYLRSNLLKIGHHGSRSSTTPSFLAAVSPSFAVISVGSRNLYGHPRREVLEELQSDHVLTLRTDTFGASSFYLDGHQVTASGGAEIDKWAVSKQ